MNKGRVRSQGSFKSSKSETQVKEEIYLPPLDVLIIKIKSLKLTSEDRRRHAVKVTFFDQLLICTTIKPVGARETDVDRTIARGVMNYDPSDYEKMCQFADCPLAVRVQPIKVVDSYPPNSEPMPLANSSISLPRSSSNKSDDPPLLNRSVNDISCCNIDILPLFKGVNTLHIEKRMQPLIDPTALQSKSWDNLPLLTMDLQVIRNSLNAQHHKILKEANFMKLTLVAAYNVIVPYDEAYTYTAASKAPSSIENNSNLVMFNEGYRYPKKFKGFSFYPKWEGLRIGDDGFTKGDEKFSFKPQDVQTEDGIDLDRYLIKVKPNCKFKIGTDCVVWGSFHRNLIFSDNHRLWNHLRQFQWPIEFHIYGEYGGYSFMGFMDLFKLLYPGETTVRLAVPLHWVNATVMMEKCGCDFLLTPNNKDLAASTEATAQFPKSKGTADTPTSTSTDIGLPRPTGADENCAFVIVEVQLSKPLIKPTIPPLIPESDIRGMLGDLENLIAKPICTGRGQLARDWQATVRSAAASLRRVPYYGMTEFCAFNRQLGETRTRVELTTSCWQEAAVYVNNNFVVQDYLESDDTFEELIMMAHACLVRETCATLVGVEIFDLDPVLRAARHARHLQDIPHATELYMQLVTKGWNNANSWRELATCLKDVDIDLANVCINNAMVLDPRDPLTILSKGSMLYEEDPDAAELFFTAILRLYPLWTTGWIIAKAFYIERQEFLMADRIMDLLNKTLAEGLAVDLASQRTWEKELGDWWDHTPLLPGMNRYFDAADLLLRLRAMSLAEVCLGRALCESGESAPYAHLVALSCRLRGDIENAMCHLRGALEAFGEVSYLRSLEAECFYQQKNREAALASFEKSGNSTSPYSTLISLPCRDPQRSRSVLVDLLRRQPCAPAWMALAGDWLTRQTAMVGDAGDGAVEADVAFSACAAACAVQALKWDRRCARAWALLAQLVRPKARRFFYRDMAAACGYEWSEDQLESLAESQHSLCYRLSKALKECHCDLCEPIKF